MREIKFRVWDKDRKVWVKFLSYCIDNITSVKKDWHDLSQYTSLKDKNGIEIYEGDIVKSINYLAVVVWVVDYACFGIEYIGGGGINTVIDNINSEIIGNIYENPELLK